MPTSPQPPRRRHRVLLEALAGTATGLLVVALLSWSAHALVSPPVLAALALWCAVSFPRVPTLGGPLPRQIKPLAQGAVTVLAITSLLVVAGVLSATVQFGVVLAVTSAAVAASTARMVRVAVGDPVRVIIVGDVMEATRWVDRWQQRADIDVVGAVLVDPDTEPESLPSELSGVPTATSLDDLAARVETWGADLVAFAPSPGLTTTLARRTAWSLQGSGVSMAVVGLFESVAPHRIVPGVIGGDTLCEVELPGQPGPVAAVKHVVDRVIAAVLLVLFLPVLALVTLLVRLDSPGAPIFRQVRIGQDGKPFVVYKVRTMTTDAEDRKHRLADANEHDGVLFKLRADPRVTRLGHYLRRSSLDELPQLVNVVRGEMSLVGPRPLVPSEVAEMGPDDLRRLSVRPGMTGLWQVSGRSDLDWDESIALDLHYADNWTLVGDAEIAVRTVKAVLGAKGAY